MTLKWDRILVTNDTGIKLRVTVEEVGKDLRIKIEPKYPQRSVLELREGVDLTPTAKGDV